MNGPNKKKKGTEFTIEKDSFALSTKKLDEIYFKIMVYFLIYRINGNIGNASDSNQDKQGREAEDREGDHAFPHILGDATLEFFINS